MAMSFPSQLQAIGGFPVDHAGAGEEVQGVISARGPIPDELGVVGRAGIARLAAGINAVPARLLVESHDHAPGGTVASLQSVHAVAAAAGPDVQAAEGVD